MGIEWRQVTAKIPFGLVIGTFATIGSGLATWGVTGSAGMALAVTSLVACGLVAIALLVTTPDEMVVDLREPETDERPRPLRAQLLFADCEPGRILIDALVLECGRGAGPSVLSGTPLALEMRMPTAEWFSASIADLLSEWSETGELVDVEMLRGPLGPRVRLSREEARITLDLTRVDGVPAPLALGA